MAEELWILIPVFNDWGAAGLLLESLDSVLAQQQMTAAVLVVNDGSSVPCPERLYTGTGAALRQVWLLQLRRNLGHQRAIAVGLAFLHSEMNGEAVVIMDGDGEDRPEDIPRLVERFRQEGGKKVVFAARTKRLEGVVFRAFYLLYRWLHRLLVGMPVRVGNFSVIPWAHLSTLVVSSELWCHYAAAVFRLRLPVEMVPAVRGRRLAGHSHMNFVALVAHGLSALAVFGDIVAVRLLVGTAIFMTVALCGGGLMAWILQSPAASAVHAVWLVVPVVVLGNAAMAAFLLGLLLLTYRVNIGFVPERDCAHYIDGNSLLFPSND